MTKNDLQKMSDLVLTQIGITYDVEKYVDTGSVSACKRIYKAGLNQYYDFHKILVKAYFLGAIQVQRTYTIYQEKDADIEIAKGIYAKDIFAPDDNFGVIYNYLLEMLQAIANEVPVTVKLGFCYRHPFRGKKSIGVHENGKAIDFSVDFGDDYFDAVSKVYTILRDNKFKFRLLYSPGFMHLEIATRRLKRDLKGYRAGQHDCLGSERDDNWVVKPNRNPLFV